jgi:hypothetical protein
LPDLTLVVPYYRNPVMLARQCQGWATWPEKYKRRLKVILVDDGSPEPAADVERPEGLPEISIYRVTEDRPWHQHAARNLGAHVAGEGWMLLTDMDHVLTAESGRLIMKSIDKGRLEPSAIYMLDRVEADTGEPTRDDRGNPKPHPNSFVVTRETFWRIGGYDEDYCGIYGTDGLFKQRAFNIAARKHLKIPLVRYWRDLVPDASTDAPRKEGRDPGARRRVAAEKAARGEADTVKTLQFPWERVL